jgi:hypothetical protein
MAARAEACHVAAGCRGTDCQGVRDVGTLRGSEAFDGRPLMSRPGVLTQCLKLTVFVYLPMCLKCCDAATGRVWSVCTCAFDTQDQTSVLRCVPPPSIVITVPKDGTSITKLAERQPG